MIEQLASDGGHGQGTAESAAFRAGRLDEAAARDAEAALRELDDARGYLLVMALRRDAPERLEAVPAQRRAEVLVAALRDLAYLTDFGYLGDEGWDGPAAQALLATGEAARGPLLGLLDDERPAPLAGSEMATMSELAGYRRRDFAARYLAAIEGEALPWAEDPAARDPHIDALRERLS